LGRPPAVDDLVEGRRQQVELVLPQAPADLAARQRISMRYRVRESEAKQPRAEPQPERALEVAAPLSLVCAALELAGVKARCSTGAMPALDGGPGPPADGPRGEQGGGRSDEQRNENPEGA